MMACLSSCFRICFIIVITYGVKQSQSFSEDSYDGINYVNMLSDPESTQKYMDQVFIVAKGVKRWASNINDFIARIFEQIMSIFGAPNKGIRKSVENVAIKTWTAIKQELPSYFQEILLQIEQLSDLFGSNSKSNPFADLGF